MHRIRSCRQATCTEKTLIHWEKAQNGPSGYDPEVRTSEIPACLWFLGRNKNPSGDCRDRRGDVLFIDARKLGHMVGWERRTIGGCFHLTMSQSPPGRTYNDDEVGMPFFQGRTDFGFRYPQNRRYCTAPTRIAKPDDTLVSVRAPVGDINMAREECCVGREVAALLHLSGSRAFTYYSAWATQQELKQYEHTRTIFGAINKRQFKALCVVEPTSEIIASFDDQIDPLDDHIKKNVAESRTLIQTRNLLLPKLMSGELRLQGSKATVKAVA